MTPYHCQYWAHLLTLKRPGGSIENLSRSISGARVDLNPHQVDAAMFALRSPLSKGALLADEVGLGKTIEAGIVLAQRWAERRRRILLIVPATLRKQWQQELDDKFYLPSVVLDSQAYKKMQKAGNVNPFLQDDKIIICSYHFVSARAKHVQGVPWDLVCIDEAHRLRNVFKPQSKMARRIADAIGPANKLLLTATPLQNSLMELYGLVSVIDEHVFGDAPSFRDQFVRAGSESARNTQLRKRLQPICIRTLRKQVIEYIPYTNRIPITQDFTPSDEEHELYERVSAFLQRDALISLPASQRQLITLVLRKLLASSTFAIAGTLQRLVGRLRALQSHLDEQRSARLASPDDTDEPPIDSIEFDTLDEISEEWPDDSDSETEQLKETTNDPIDPQLLQEEIEELAASADLAQHISQNAKGEALLPALEVAFSHTPVKKAVIFTESRRTQQYLFDLLSERGYEGQLALMNGSNDDPLSRRIYADWLERHEGEDCVSGSKAVDIKAAIVDEFRERASILIATEAAAEGVNLQFCSLVVNFDLPWNPQRIEQRIGRCHRYGQKHDVVVVNFLNRRNEADQRVFELLSEKFRLFDGVFGSSDEVLGALESGVDLERRIASVYQSCRTAEEISSAFDQLQAQLDEQIQTRMEDTRQLLLENFDEEVTSRLRVHRDQTLEKLSERERWLLELTRGELNGEAEFDSKQPRFRYSGDLARRGHYHLDWKKAEKLGDTFYRQEHPLASQLIQRAIDRHLESTMLKLSYSDYGGVVSTLQPLIGRAGWLEVSKLSITSLDEEEFLILVGTIDQGEALDEEQCQKLLRLPAQVSDSIANSLPDLSDLRTTAVNRRIREVEERNVEFFDEEVLKLDHWSDDLKQSLEGEIKEIDKEIREARKVAALAGSLSEKLAAQKMIKTLESTRKDKRKRLFEAQDEIDSRRDELIERIEIQLAQKQTVTHLFTVRWVLN